MSYYTQNSGKLKDFLKEIQRVQTPTKATTDWLRGLGFTSSNDLAFLRVLKQINFLQTDGTPTPYYIDFRDMTKSKVIMAKALKEGFSILYETYPNAHEEPDDKIKNQFKAKVNLGERTATFATLTFRTLCEFADFTALESGISPTPPSPEPVAPTLQPSPQPTITLTADQISGLTTQKRELGVNINIQVSLPETTDADVYDKIFAALKKHFFSE